MIEKDNHASIAEPVLMTLSPSRASDFKTCPQLFKFKSIDKIPTIPTKFQANVRFLKDFGVRNGPEGFQAVLTFTKSW